MGKKNLIIGSLWIMLFMLLGGFLETKLADAEWKKTMAHHLLVSAHIHGGMFGVLNVLYGILIGKLRLSGTGIAAGSWLSIAGALIFPIFMMGTLVLDPLKFAIPLGGLSMILAWAIMFYSVLKAES